MMPEISGPAPFGFSLFNGRQALQLVGSGTTCCLPRSVRGTGGRTSATNTARACSAPSTLGPRHQKRMSLPHHQLRITKDCTNGPASFLVGYDSCYIQPRYRQWHPWRRQGPQSRGESLLLLRPHQGVGLAFSHMSYPCTRGLRFFADANVVAAFFCTHWSRFFADGLAVAAFRTYHLRKKALSRAHLATKTTAAARGRAQGVGLARFCPASHPFFFFFCNLAPLAFLHLAAHHLTCKPQPPRD
jgi:hypothetical protein